MTLGEKGVAGKGPNHFNAPSDVITAWTGRHDRRPRKEPTMETMGRRFRELLREEDYVFTGGVYSPLDAQIAERVGMKSIYLSGYSMALSNGWPDMGFLTQTEVTRIASMVASAVNIPIIADADDGYGNALSTIRTVQEFVKTGVAGIHLEDQRFPKRCGHIAGKTVVPFEEAVGKFRAAVDTRNRLDPDFVLIARTDARGAHGGSLDEAIRRANAYLDAGADLAFVEGPTSLDEIRRVCREVRGPIFYNQTGVSPRFSLAEMRELGIAVTILPGAAMRVTIQAVYDFARALREAVTAAWGRPLPMNVSLPIAAVMLGGLVTTAVFSLHVVPALYLRFGAGREPDLALDADAPAGAPTPA